MIKTSAARLETSEGGKSMSKRLVASSIWRSIVPTVALGSLAAGTLLYAAAPADAAARTCFAVAQACEQRCSKAYSDYGGCISRTCTPQYNNCVAGGGERGPNDKTTPGPKGGGKGGGKGRGFSGAVSGATTGGQPAPVTSGSTSANAGAQPVVKPSGVGTAKPFGVGPVKSVSQR